MLVTASENSTSTPPTTPRNRSPPRVSCWAPGIGAGSEGYLTYTVVKTPGAPRKQHQS